MLNQKRIAPAEMEILRYVMDNEPVSAREVADAMMEKKGFARSTSQTLLERLRLKSYLNRSPREGVNQYELGIPRAELMKALVSDFVESSLGGSMSPFVAYFTERGNLSDDEAKKLSELLDKLEEKP
jgi:predicted transcriptional regulator